MTPKTNPEDVDIVERFTTFLTKDVMVELVERVS